MKRYLLPEQGNFYKANLHCHSVISDGSLTPEELKKGYKANGYSVLAYTDHDVMIPHHDLTDDEFLAITGFEMEFNEFDTSGAGPDQKTAHLCFLAGTPDTELQPCWNEKYADEKHGGSYRHLVKSDPAKAPFVRSHTPESINAAIREAREAGFFVTYNHPGWSLESFEDYSRYEGMNAMEIFNTECQNIGYEAYEPRVYDEMLRGGQRIYAVAADDNHNKRAGDSYGGFVMIKAKKLEYKTITDALFAGNFYASQGPEIYELYVEGQEIHVRCSDAASIHLTSGRRTSQKKHAPAGETINEAVFVLRDGDPYFRITVTDRCGKHADTRAYFLDEL